MANLVKCHLRYTKTKYLGYILGNRKISPLVNKRRTLVEVPVPTTEKQLKSVLGLTSYYQHLMSQFAAITAPLTDLVRKGAPQRIQWLSKCETVFGAIKQLLCNVLVLCSLDSTKEFILQTGTSDIVLSQELEDGEHLILYLRRKLLPQKQKYTIIEKECLAVWAL